MKLLFWLIALVLFGPFALVAFLLWICAIAFVLFIRLIALLFGIGAWLGLGSVLFPTAIAAGLRGSRDPGRPASITLCANCNAPVAHSPMGWLHVDTNAWACRYLLHPTPTDPRRS